MGNPNLANHQRHGKVLLFYISIIVLASEANANLLQMFKLRDTEVQSYEECLLENLTGIESNEAVLEIRRSCRILIRNAERSSCKSNITEQMQGALQGKLGHRSPAAYDSLSSGVVTGTLYNMSQDYRITVVKISVSGIFNQVDFTKDFSTDVWLNPLTESVVSFGTGMRRIDNFSWRIREISGCKAS